MPKKLFVESGPLKGKTVLVETLVPGDVVKLQGHVYILRWYQCRDAEGAHIASQLRLFSGATPYPPQLVRRTLYGLPV